jgi:hypothetical protein
MNSNPEDIIIHVDGTTAYIPGIKTAIIQQSDSSIIFAKPDANPVNITVKGNKETMEVVPWGERNDLPQQIIQKVSKLPQMGTNLWFNIVASYGEGIKPVRITWENDKPVITPYLDNEEVNRFFEENDTSFYLLEQMTDMHWFFNVFPEIIFNKENGKARKIVELRSKEASFSRWSPMDKTTGRIMWHYYFAYWGDYQPDEQDKICTSTPVLDFHNPIRHLREIMEEDNTKNWDKRRNRFIVPVSFPTPNRNYYQKPYWYSLIESGWYDFATKIPEFKKAIMDNQISVKYIVYLAPGFFEEIFRREKITAEKDQTARIKKEYADIRKFLQGADKAGRSIITFQKFDPNGKPYPMITVEPVKNEKAAGGDYLEDSEEVSNIIAYAMMVNPSIIGPSPGKNKTINGTEARELFIIKQALLKPFRDRILRPLYLIKAINNWPADLHFSIPNVELTTLDKDKTGSVTKNNI